MSTAPTSVRPITQLETERNLNEYASQNKAADRAKAAQRLIDLKAKAAQGQVVGASVPKLPVVEVVATVEDGPNGSDIVIRIPQEQLFASLRISSTEASWGICAHITGTELALVCPDHPRYGEGMIVLNPRGMTLNMFGKNPPNWTPGSSTDQGPSQA